MAVPSASLFRRRLFKALHPVDIDSWHRLGDMGGSSAFLRNVAEEILANAGGWSGAATPSVVGATKSIALRRSEDVSWPPAGGGGPAGIVADDERRLKGQRHRHLFAGDRAYWFRRPSLPGRFEGGLTTTRRTPNSTRLVLSLFENGLEEPSLLYVADRICVDSAGKPSAPSQELERALRSLEAGFTGGRFGL
eukprot:TRINITY_DN77518_c0_g1_i1.p1 TRINITY_DN77518_c0_g1~~TRINITY_DN77518_c0_g1_i1.p1  ORF type:complete len:193 (+),score=40.05 TRINITY_DN77518_c0_g1_i1:48-626(+)